MEEMIEITVNDIQVVGTASGSEWDLKVSIQKPFGPYFSSLHVPFFGRNSEHHKMMVSGKLSEHGRSSANVLLAELYGKLEKRVRLQEEIAEALNQRIVQIVSMFGGKLDKVWLKEETDWLRGLLDSKAIEAQQYQKRLTWVRKLNSSFEFNVCDDPSGFMKEKTGVSLDEILIDQNYEEILRLISAGA